MKVMTTFIGAALTAASLAFAGPAFAGTGHAGFAPHAPAGASGHAAVGATMGSEHSVESVGLGASQGASAGGTAGAGTHTNQCESFGAAGPC
jgi:hypothetical protein